MVNPQSLELNAFAIKIEPKNFAIFKQEFQDNKQFKSLREKLQDEWFLMWKQGVVYGIPKIAQPSTTFGTTATLHTTSYVGLAVLNSRANELLPSLVPTYQADRKRYQRGINFVAQRVELVSEITGSWNVAPIMGDFKIRPRF